MELRKAELNDIDTLIAMREIYLTADFGQIEQSVIEQVKDGLKPYLAQHLGKDFTAFLAEEDGKIAATVYMVEFEKPPSPSQPNGKTATLFNVYTALEFRRRGLAASLVEMAIQQCKEHRVDFLDLQATEDGAPLYRKLGFVQQGDHYTNMKLDFTEGLPAI